MAKDGPGHYLDLLDDDSAEGGGLALAGWGLTAVVAVVAGFAAWQYAPPRPIETVAARVDLVQPTPEEVTGSVGRVDRLPTPSASRVVGGGRITPTPLAAGETLATSRDIDQLRNEIRELQRRLAQVSLGGDGLARRVDRVEERLAGDIATGRERLAAGSLPPVAAAAVEPAAVDGEAAARPPERRDETIPMPTPRPSLEPAAVTGSIPPKAATQPAGRPAPTAEVKPPEVKPAEAKVIDARAPETKPVEAKPVEVRQIDMRAPAPPPTAPPLAAASSPLPVLGAPELPSPNGDSVAVDLGGYRSLATLKKSWSDLTDRYAEFGRNMEPLARLKETESGMEVRLVAGPFPVPSDAAKLCLKLRAAGANCSVTAYGGQPIAGLR